MKYIRYKGEFVSIGGHVWRAEIWQESAAPFFSIGDLEFDADMPIQIEWNETAKEEVICSSVATLHIVSPGDRTYQDLYTIEPGKVRLDVYRDDALYWSGCIDTEFYEEPYEQEKDYTVEMTFSDFGILKRLKCGMNGMMSVRDIITHCISKTEIKSGMLDMSMVSTQLKADGKITDGRDITVHSANFSDEDGEAMPLDEVLEGVLQPLGMKIEQRNGKVYVYDLNGLYNGKRTEEIYWNGDSQTLSTDKVYNEAKITWSPYVREGNQWEERCWGFTKTNANLTALNMLDGKTEGDATYYTYHASKDAGRWLKENDYGFTLWTSEKGENVRLLNSGLRFFKIVPQLDGSKDEGIAIRFATWKVVEDTFTHADYKLHGTGWTIMAGTASGAKNVLTEGKSTYLPPLLREGSLMLKVKMDTLIDVRTNFYEEAENTNFGVPEKDRMENCKKWANFLYVPVRIMFRPSGTNDLYIWDNRAAVERDRKYAVTVMSDTYGEWKPFVRGTSTQWGWLAYYDIKDRAETSAIGGWQTNKPAINPHTEKLESMLEKTEDGQYIPYPNFGGKGGEIWLEVCDGWIINDGNKDLPAELPSSNTDIWKTSLWTMMRLPKLEILSNVQFDAELDTDDIEYSGRLNEYAKDSLDIDTICGTSEEGVPTARGAYYDAETNMQITQLTRAGRTATAEDLLIGTLHSQYAERHVMLSGETNLLNGEVKTYTEQNQEGKKLICVSDVQDVRMETSDAVFIELRPDEYKAEKYEEI